MRCMCRVESSILSWPREGAQREEFGWDTRTWRGSVGGIAQGCLDASGESLRGRHVDGAVGFSFCQGFKVVSVKAQSREQGSLLTSRFAGVSPARRRRSCRSSSTGSQSGRDPSEEVGAVDLVERVLQVHGQQAPCFVVFLASKPQCVGVDSGLTAACDSAPRLRRAAVAVRRRQSLSHRNWVVIAVLFLQSRERGTGDPGGHGAWHVAHGHDADHAVEGS